MLEDRKIVDMTNGKREYFCSHCGIMIYNDHGWILDDGSVICKDRVHCERRRYVKKEKEAKENGTYVKPRWRI